MSTTSPSHDDIPLRPLISWNAPSDHIQLFAGEIGFRTSKVQTKPAPGEINIMFRQGTHLDWLVDLDQVDGADRSAWDYSAHYQELGEIYFDFAGLNTRVPSYTSSSGRGFVQPAPMSDQSSSRVIAHWVNLPELPHQKPLRSETAGRGWQQWSGRWQLDLGPWAITIDSRPDLSNAYREAKRNFFSVLTHTMEVCRIDGDHFIAQAADHVHEGMQLAFSFALGRWAAPILAVGFDDADKPVHSSWVPLHVTTPGRDADRWWPHLWSDQELKSYLAAFWTHWNNDIERVHLNFLDYVCTGSRPGRLYRTTAYDFPRCP